MVLFLLIVIGIIVLFFLIYKGFQYENSDEQKERRRINNMTEAERFEYHRQELEKIHAKERENWTKYVEPSKNRLGTEIMGVEYLTDKAEMAIRSLVPGSVLHLQMEPNNRYDKYAIKILTEDDIHIGYVQKEYSEFVTRHFDNILGCRVAGIPDEAERIAWGIRQFYCAAIFFTEDVDIPKDGILVSLCEKTA